MSEERRLAELTRHESLRLLGSVNFGRIVFTHHALPAVRPVNHLLDGDHVIVRTTPISAISIDLDGTGMVVAYEADMIDAADRLGWSVVVVGRAMRVRDEARQARYRQALDSWVTRERDEVIAIGAEMVTGFRLVPGPAPAGPPGTGAAGRWPRYG